ERLVNQGGDLVPLAVLLQRRPHQGQQPLDHRGGRGGAAGRHVDQLAVQPVARRVPLGRPEQFGPGVADGLAAPVGGVAGAGQAARGGAAAERRGRRRGGGGRRGETGEGAWGGGEGGRTSTGEDRSGGRGREIDGGGGAARGGGRRGGGCRWREECFRWRRRA